MLIFGMAKIAAEVNSKLCEFSGVIESLNVDQANQIQEINMRMRALGEWQLKKIASHKKGSW